jgi:hypothetical protein
MSECHLSSQLHLLSAIRYKCSLALRFRSKRLTSRLADTATDNTLLGVVVEQLSIKNSANLTASKLHQSKQTSQKDINNLICNDKILNIYLEQCYSYLVFYNKKFKSFYILYLDNRYQNF